MIARQLMSLGLILGFLVGCGPTGAADPSDQFLFARLPASIEGVQIAYREVAEADLEGERVFFDAAVAAAGGQPATARVAVGTDGVGNTIVALEVPRADGRGMIDPIITSADFEATRRVTAEVGDKSVTVLDLPPTSADTAYVYAFADIVVVLETADPAWAAEVLRALP